MGVLEDGHTHAEVVRKKLRYFFRQVALLVSVVLGFFGPRLGKIVRRTVSAQLKGNAEFRVHRYPILVRAVRWAIGNPKPAMTGLLCAYLAAFLLQYHRMHAGAVSAENVGESVRDFWTVNLGIFAVQAALVGVVFPLVIAFVGLLNQGRASFASRLTVYIDSSAALFVGVSSLLLCVSIALQLPLGDSFVHVSGAVTALNVLWFSVNALALCYFVLRTISFLHPSKRAPIMRAYVANEIWPRELTIAITADQWSGVTKLNHLPAGDDLDPFAPGPRATVRYFGLWEKGEPRVERFLPRKMKLVDVRFGVLRPVVDDWLSHAQQAGGEEAHDLVIPLQPGNDYNGDQVLARSTVPLSFVARTAVKNSFRFRSTLVDLGRISATNQIFGEMIADLIELIDQRRASEFADQLSDVVDFHVFLYRLAQKSDEDFNYAYLRTGAGIFSRRLSEQWAEAYRDVTRRVVERLPDEPEFMRPMAFIPYKIFVRTDGITSTALQPIIQLGEDLSGRLIDWATGEYRAESPTGIGDREPFSLSHQGEVYAHAWREQVAGWEALLKAVSKETDRTEDCAQRWERLRLTSENLWIHLFATMRMTARAVWAGDTLATSWTNDLMLHWKKQAEVRSIRTRRPWRVHSEAITLQELNFSWADVEDLQLTPSGDVITPERLFDEILNNVWRDHTLVLASLFIHWAMNQLSGDTATQAARMLLHGEHYDRGDRDTRDFPANSGVDFLVSALRVVGSGTQFSEGSYAGRIDHLLEGLSRLGEAPRISMRMYTSVGGLSFSTLPSAQVIALLALMPRQQSANEALRRLLTRGEDKALRRREALLRALESAIEELDEERHSILLAALIGPAEDLSFEERRTNAHQLIEQSLVVLTRYRDQAIIEAPIDTDRIAAVGSAAASKAFSKTEFPRHLFDEIVLTSDRLTEFNMRVSGLNRGEFTRPLMGEPVLNEAEWWRDVMSDRVADVVWSDVLQQLHPIRIDSQTPLEFWHAVREGSERIRTIGHDPLLVIDNASAPEWLYDWQWSHESGSSSKPEDLVITNEANQVAAYEFTMNDTPVYRARIESGVAILIPSRLLQTLQFHDYGEGLPVSPQFEADDQERWLGTMRVSFERRVELADDIPSYRIGYGDDR
jgi:hypothetical protein